MGQNHQNFVANLVANSYRLERSLNRWGRKQGMLWLLRRPTVVSADRLIGDPALGHHRHVNRAVAATKAALGNPKVKIRCKLHSGKTPVCGKDRHVLDHYRALIKPADAERFYKIMPPEPLNKIIPFPVQAEA